MRSMKASTPDIPAAPVSDETALRFRAFEERDFDALLAWVPSEEFLLQWAGINFTWPLDRDQLASYLGESRGEGAHRVIWSVEDATGKLVGHIGYRDIDRRNDCAVLSCVLVGDPAARSRRIGRAMVAEAVRRGFEEFGLNRVQLSVFDFNAGAIRCYDSVGFVREGLFREYRKIKGDYWNVVQMALLRRDW